MAHAIGAKVVAEGVESEEVGRLLCELGCDEAQGYYFARPGPAEEMSEWLTPEAMSPKICCAA